MLIRDLQKQLEELKKGAACAVPAKDLSIGDGEGDDLMEDVKKVQEFLNEKGYFTRKSTGYFGKLTRASLTSFQKDLGLTQSGAFDAETRAKVATLTCKKSFMSEKTTVEWEKAKQVPEKPKMPSAQVGTITLIADGTKVKWTSVGVAAGGFKLIWSKNTGPIYPPRDGDRAEYQSPGASGYAMPSALSGAGTYYVRVCEFTGSGCGVYSNEVMVTLQ